MRHMVPITPSRRLLHPAAEPVPGGPLAAFVVMPANTVCNSNLDALGLSLSHEMVEAATDPFFNGWQDYQPNDIIGVTHC